jgi:membrane-associated protease RseP (regulator of RpoE activity)
MQSLLFSLVLAIPVCIAVHLLAVAATARLIGVKVLVISLGLGPTLASIGILRLGGFPIGGFVKLKDSREEPVPLNEMGAAFDGRSALEQIAISLSGCAMLVLLSISLLGRDGLQAFLIAPAQLLHGAIAPFSTAQVLIAESLSLLSAAPPATDVAYAAAKLAALNILPLPALNGGAALAALGRALKIDSLWSSNLTKILMFATVGIALSWFTAGLLYARSF